MHDAPVTKAHMVTVRQKYRISRLLSGCAQALRVEEVEVGRSLRVGLDVEAEGIDVTSIDGDRVDDERTVIHHWVWGEHEPPLVELELTRELSGSG
jgi:hypothetical protein